MSLNPESRALFENIIRKGALKQEVYQHTQLTFNLMKKVMAKLSKEYNRARVPGYEEIPFLFKDKGEFEAELRFAGDVLIFMMHTNIFEFSRHHEIMRLPYIQEDLERSYCGVINIYNFLNDSFRYNRMNDVGYMIGRVFINKDNHYFSEGKKEIGFLYQDFASSRVTEKGIRAIIESAVMYTVNFDLLTPPYDQVKEVTLDEFESALSQMKMKTGKRLGFKFQADNQ